MGGRNISLPEPELSASALSPSPGAADSAKSPVQLKIHIFEGKGAPQKAPPKPKLPQVKTRKWIKKKNGLFGWVTSVTKPGKVEDPPKFSKKEGVGIFQTVKVNHNITEGKWGIRESAVERLKTFEGQSSC